MPGLSELIDTIATTLWKRISAPHLPGICMQLGLPNGEEAEAYSSKRAYVQKRISGWEKERLLQLAKRVNEMYPSESLQLVIEAFVPDECLQISTITRQHVIAEITELGPMEGKVELIEFLERLWDIRSMPSSGEDYRCLTIADEIRQHMIRNNDYSYADMLGHLELRTASHRKFAEFLEWVVHPLVRVGSEQQRYVDFFNEHLRHDGVALVPSECMAQHPLFRLTQIVGGVRGAAKNLVFASSGPKPDIVLSDAVNNDIQIVRNAEFCLMYDRPLSSDGLLWTHLVEWWGTKKEGGDIDSSETERGLYLRLRESLASPPERLLFHSYFHHFRPRLKARLPAIVPQVYLHYDPYTSLRLKGEKRLARQRMDFLLLFSSYQRIVIEVDGKQHYADDNGASPARYAEMVAADRDLRLCGYEVYRFGGAELTGEHGKKIVESFFTRLFKKHGIK